MSKSFSVYVELLICAESKNEATEVVQDELSDTFGIENFAIFDTQELDQSEIADIKESMVKNVARLEACEHEGV